MKAVQDVKRILAAGKVPHPLSTNDDFCFRLPEAWQSWANAMNTRTYLFQ